MAGEYSGIYPQLQLLKRHKQAGDLKFSDSVVNSARLSLKWWGGGSKRQGNANYQSTQMELCSISIR